MLALHAWFLVSLCIATCCEQVPVTRVNRFGRLSRRYWQRRTSEAKGPCFRLVRLAIFVVRVSLFCPSAWPSANLQNSLFVPLHTIPQLHRMDLIYSKWLMSHSTACKAGLLYSEYVTVTAFPIFIICRSPLGCWHGKEGEASLAAAEASQTAETALTCLCD